MITSSLLWRQRRRKSNNCQNSIPPPTPPCTKSMTCPHITNDVFSSWFSNYKHENLIIGNPHALETSCTQSNDCQPPSRLPSVRNPLWHFRITRSRATAATTNSSVTLSCTTSPLPTTLGHSWAHPGPRPPPVHNSCMYDTHYVQLGWHGCGKH